MRLFSQHALSQAPFVQFGVSYSISTQVFLLVSSGPLFQGLGSWDQVVLVEEVDGFPLLWGRFSLTVWLAQFCKIFPREEMQSFLYPEEGCLLH